MEKIGTHRSPTTIGLVGDVHGSLPHSVAAIAALAAKGITEVHFLGDFGFLWTGAPIEEGRLNTLNGLLRNKGQTAFVTTGNHENYDLIEPIIADSDGIKWVRDSIGILPRGWRAETPSGRVLASLGGANSIDRYQRVPHLSWWPQEQIEQADVDALGTTPVDILLGHDSPTTDTLVDYLAPSAHLWDPRGLSYSNDGRQVFHDAFLQVRPRIVISGHYHCHLDTFEKFVTKDGVDFESRVVILHESRFPRFVAYLDTTSLDLKVIRDVYSFASQNKTKT